MRKKFFPLLASSFCCVLAGAAEIYVDYNASGRGNGSRQDPFPNFDRAIVRAKPGDTVRILPAGKIIHDTLRIRDVNGTAKSPIVIDGMCNIFSGVKAVDPADWKEVRPGVYCRRSVMPKAMVSRYFLVIRGRIVRMGRYSKGAGSARLKDPDSLLPGEWTIRSAAEKNQRDIFVRLPEGCASLKDARIEEPGTKTVSGVHISGKKGSSHIRLRNIIVRHVWNDGFNFHGPNTHLELENIAAVECGDDGISAHEENQIVVRNYVAIGNSTGICHVQKADCCHENVYLEGNLGVDIEFTRDTRNVLINAAVKGSSHDGILVLNRTGSLLMANCRFVNRAKTAVFSFPAKSELKTTLKDVKFADYRTRNCPADAEKTDAANLTPAVEELRKKLFALFNGQLERALEP